MEKQKKIPKLRFPEFEGVWEKKKLGQIYKFKVTNSFSRADLNYENGFIKNIHYGDIHTQFATLFDIVKEAVPFVNQEINTDRIEEENYCQVGDLIFADASEDYNDIGKCIEIVNLNNEKVLSGLHTLLARPEKSKMASGFAGHLMKSHNVKLQIQREAQGTKVLSITSGRLSQVDLVYPSLSEQQKIASFFTAIDQKISHLKRKKKLLEQYKKGVMQKIFTQEIRFKDDNGQEFPKWEKKKLGELTYKTGKKNKDSTPFPIYSINNREGFLPQGDQFEGVDSNSRGYDISLYKIIEEKTFAYNPARINVGSIGFSGDLKNIIISSLYVCFKTKQGLEDAYLLHYLKTFQFNKSVLQNVEGGVRDYLFYENFSNIKINLPTNKEQLKIISFLSAIDYKINHTQKQIEKSEVWKKGLMQQMFC